MLYNMAIAELDMSIATKEGKEAATEETIRQQTKHILSSMSMEGREEAYGA